MPDRLHHAPDLAVAPLVQHQLDHSGPALRTLAQLADQRIRGRTALPRQQQAALQTPKGLGERAPLDGRVVRLAQAVARVGDRLHEIAVVAQQDQPFRVGVEAPGGHQTHPRKRHEIGHFMDSVAVGDGRDIARRFVKRDIAPGRRADHRPAIDREDAGLGINESAGGPDDLAVDAHPAGGDHLLGAAAGRDSGGGQRFLQTFARNGARRRRGFHGRIVPEANRRCRFPARPAAENSPRAAAVPPAPPPQRARGRWPLRARPARPRGVRSPGPARPER